jgi:membrane protease subunit HflK
MPETPAGEASVQGDLRAALSRWRLATRVVLALAAVVYLATGICVIQPDEEGVVRRFGKAVRLVPPGIHYRLPFPAEQLTRLKTKEIKRMSVGFRIIDQVQGRTPSREETQFLTGDENIINLQMMIQYAISDPAAFLFGADRVPTLVRRAGEAALTEIVGAMGVDDLLTAKKLEVQISVRDYIQETLNGYNAGVRVLAAHLTDVSPPLEVADAFRDVASAREDRNRIVNEAHGYVSDILPQARGEAQKTLQEAEAYESDVVNRATGDAERFLKAYTEYRKAKSTTATRLYLETVEQVLANSSVYVVDRNRAGAAATIRLYQKQ